MYNNPKIVSIAGLVLFLLGILSAFLVYHRGDASPDTLQLVLGAAVLLSLGSSSLAVSGLLRLEKRVAELEAHREK